MKSIALLLAALAAFASVSHADDGAQETAQMKQLREALAVTMPDLEITSISESPIPGLLELVTGPQVVYITPDGKYVIEGNMIDIERRINMTQQRRGKTQVAALNSMGEEKMVVYPATSDKSDQRSITVITDTTCPYCSKLHAEINGLLSQGVSVRYLLYPRAGLNSPAHRQLESVWCAEDPLEAMTLAKAGQSIPEKRCDNPIQEHMAFARQAGLQGTPMIFLDNGLVVPGYRPPQELIRLLESEPRIGG